MTIYGVPRKGDRISPKWSAGLDAQLAILPIGALLFAWALHLDKRAFGVALRNHLWFSYLAVILYVVVAWAGGRWKMDVYDRRYRQQDRLWRYNGMYFNFQNGVLTRHITGELDVTIAVSEITEIQESPEFLRVSALTGWVLYVPADTEHYQELRFQLMTARPETVTCETPRPSWLTPVSVLSALLIPGSFILLPSLHTTASKHLAIALLVTGWAWLWVCLPLINHRRTHTRLSPVGNAAALKDARQQVV